MYKFSLAVVTLVFLVSRPEFSFTNAEGVGDPLILTPYIQNNKIDEARQAAVVRSDYFFNVTSYSGYLTVDKKFDSNMFFWFFPAEENYETAPVLLWLQGGPGGSSLFATLNEHGPFLLKNATATNFTLELNEYSWTKNHSVIYIDNPVQTGFSFTNGGYAQNQTKVGQDLYQALKQFFSMFPELQKNEFYITGESYAGKFIPAIAHAILKNNPKSDLKINLKGLSIGDGVCDPEHQMNFGDFFFQIGLIDSNARKTFLNTEEKIVNYIKDKQFRKAFELYDDLVNGDLNGGNTFFKNLTGFPNNFDYVNFQFPRIDFLLLFFQQEHIRRSIHAGNITYNWSTDVEEHMIDDIMVSVAPWITELLSNYRVMFYSGQHDAIVPYPLTVNFLQNLNFSSVAEYKTAERHIWRSGNDIAGYVKTAGNLTEVLVRNAGHIVVISQPAWALELITKFTRNQPIHSN